MVGRKGSREQRGGVDRRGARVMVGRKGARVWGRSQGSNGGVVGRKRARRGG